MKSLVFDLLLQSEQMPSLCGMQSQEIENKVSMCKNDPWICQRGEKKPTHPCGQVTGATSALRARVPTWLSTTMDLPLAASDTEGIATTSCEGTAILVALLGK